MSVKRSFPLTMVVTSLVLVACYQSTIWNDDAGAISDGDSTWDSHADSDVESWEDADRTTKRGNSCFDPIRVHTMHFVYEGNAEDFDDTPIAPGSCSFPLLPDIWFEIAVPSQHIVVGLDNEEGAHMYHPTTSCSPADCSLVGPLTENGFSFTNDDREERTIMVVVDFYFLNAASTLFEFEFTIEPIAP